MKTNKQSTNWMIDAIFFAAFLGSFLLDFTGVSLHQWLGAALGVFAAVHLLIHWDWVKSVTSRFLKRTSMQARVYYLVDASLFLGLFLILVTGLAISTWFSFSLGDTTVWKNIHILASMATLLVVALKIGIHWRWVISVARRSIFPHVLPVDKANLAQPGSACSAMIRREFLKLMGVVCVATVLAVGSGLDGIEKAVTQGTTSGDTSQAASASTSTQSLAQSQTSASCVVRCNRGCTYPGHCPRYADTNQNNRCDLGECI